VISRRLSVHFLWIPQIGTSNLAARGGFHVASIGIARNISFERTDHAVPPFQRAITSTCTFGADENSRQFRAPFPVVSRSEAPRRADNDPFLIDLRLRRAFSFREHSRRKNFLRRDEWDLRGRVTRPTVRFLGPSISNWFPPVENLRAISGVRSLARSRFIRRYYPAPRGRLLLQREEIRTRGDAIPAMGRTGGRVTGGGGGIGIRRGPRSATREIIAQEGCRARARARTPWLSVLA